MIKKGLLGAIFTILFLELLLRVGFSLPDRGAFLYDRHTHLLFNRPEFKGSVPTQRFFELGRFARTSSSELPALVRVEHSSEGFRQGPQGFRQHKGPGLLLLGDSVSYGWPLAYEDSHLPFLENITSRPVRSCSLLAAGAVQLREILRHHCQHPGGWERVVLQLTIHSDFAFPDALFLDNLGPDFHGKIAYLSYAPSPHLFFPTRWFETSATVEEAIDEFADSFFNNYHLISGTYLEKVLQYLTQETPHRQAPASLQVLTEITRKKVPLEERHLATVQAIMSLKETLGIPLAVYLHPTRNLALSRAERPDIENLKQTLKSLDIPVFDQRSDPEFQHILAEYYFPEDLHPQKRGYHYFSEKVSELLQLKK